MSRNVIGLLGTRRGRWKSRRRNGGNSRVDETGGNGESTGGDRPRIREREVSHFLSLSLDIYVHVPVEPRSLLPRAVKSHRKLQVLSVQTADGRSLGALNK